MQGMMPKSGNMTAPEDNVFGLKDKYGKETNNATVVQGTAAKSKTITTTDENAFGLKDKYVKDNGNLAGTQVTIPNSGTMTSAGKQALGARPQCRKDTSYYGGTQGWLPPCGDLASPYVPNLEPLPERYSHTDALNNGTLFPALNLPFHLKVNAENVVTTPLNELQALEFVITELGLYLDTHPDDEEAFFVYKQYVDLEKKAREAYARNKDPLFQTDSAKHDSFAWVRDPWPWHLKD